MADPRARTFTVEGADAGPAERSSPEQRDVVARAAVEREVGEDLADDAAELEAVAGEAGGDDDLRRVGEQVDDEVLVGRVGEQARFIASVGPSASGKVATDAVAQDRFVVGDAGAIDGSGSTSSARW